MDKQIVRRLEIARMDGGRIDDKWMGRQMDG